MVHENIFRIVSLRHSNWNLHASIDNNIRTLFGQTQFSRKRTSKKDCESKNLKDGEMHSALICKRMFTERCGYIYIMCCLRRRKNEWREGQCRRKTGEWPCKNFEERFPAQREKLRWSEIFGTGFCRPKRCSILHFFPSKRCVSRILYLEGLKLKGKEKTKVTISWQPLVSWYILEWQPFLLVSASKRVCIK